jgi:hypothetical protein
MKRTFINIASKKVLAAVLLSGAVLFVTPNAVKATPTNIEIISSTNQASIQFAGSSDNALVFDVKVANANGDKFTITVADNDNNVLFTQSFSEKNFDKKFKLIKSDEISRYNFKITSTNKDLEQAFSVNASTKVVDDVVITKL